LSELGPPDADELLVVVGPTASGKSALAMSLAGRFDGEIIGADSVQIYRHFDVGSGKPSVDERARVAHHLVDAVDPLDHLDAADWAERAARAVADIRARGRTPIVCGGTFLWIKALVWGLAPTPPADQAVRRRHAATVEASGRGALHAELARVDPARAASLAPNDFVRVSRALEVFELTGTTQTAWHGAHQFREARHRARFVGPRAERAALDARIRQRALGWLADGWVDEVRALRARGWSEARAMASVGYRQVAAMLDGDLDERELCDAIVRATRVFARRQRTWLRDLPVTWLDG
jgi:tRNA dimethylallyltransferase